MQLHFCDLRNVQSHLHFAPWNLANYNWITCVSDANRILPCSSEDLLTSPSKTYAKRQPTLSCHTKTSFKTYRGVSGQVGVPLAAFEIPSSVPSE